MARELKEGDRLIDWDGERGTVASVGKETFSLEYDDGSTSSYGWVEFDPERDLTDPSGTFRFADTEYPEWPL